MTDNKGQEKQGEFEKETLKENDIGSTEKGNKGKEEIITTKKMDQHD